MCTVAAVVFLLALNSYCVVITNKYCEKNPCLQYHPPKLSGQRTWFQSSMTKYSHNMRLVNPPPVQWNKDFDWLTQAWLTQAAVTDLTAWFWSCSLAYISRSGTHGFSSATRLSNVATSRQLCTHEQIQSHHSTSLLKQRYQKPLIQSIPFHDIFFHMFYTGYPLVNHTVILK